MSARIAQAASVRHLRRNIRLLYAENFFSNSSFILPIYILFSRQYLGISIVQAGSFLVVSNLATIVCDFWGGVLADRLGRKRIFIVGTALQILSYVPFLVVRSYPALLISSVVHGIGIAFAQNSIDALLYEQAVALGQNKAYLHANANLQIFAFLGRIYASIVGGLAFKADPRLPYLLTVVTLLAALASGAATVFPYAV